MKRTKKSLFLSVVGGLLGFQGVLAYSAPAKFKVDPSHSTVAFSVSHLGISSVTGKFTEFEGEFEFDTEKNLLISSKGQIKTASINTEEKDRDKHLRDKDFFDVTKKGNETISFVLTSYKVDTSSPMKGTASGTLTMNSVTKPIDLAVEVGGSVKNPWGKTVAAFKATGKLNRKDYGISFGKVMDNGGLVVGDEVNLELKVEGVMEDGAGTPKGAEKKAPEKKDAKKK